jgi:hypothetical protein
MFGLSGFKKSIRLRCEIAAQGAHLIDVRTRPRWRRA